MHLCRCKATTCTNVSTLKYCGITNTQMHFNMEQLQTCTHIVKCIYPSHSSNWILPCATCLHSDYSNTTQMLPKGCPNVAQRLHKSCPKAAQKLPRSHPKATPKLLESYPFIFIGLPKHAHSLIHRLAQTGAHCNRQLVHIALFMHRCANLCSSNTYSDMYKHMLGIYVAYYILHI